MAKRQAASLTPLPGSGGGRDASLACGLFRTRQHSLDIARPLSAEDMTVQPMEDASPTKWHLAHVTWFFETFILVPHAPGYRVFDDNFAYCFNSYYESAGPRQPRPFRGMLTRPSLDRVIDYRAHVDAALGQLSRNDGLEAGEIARLVEIGINHEQQHQELMLTDILALFAANPLRPAYGEPAQRRDGGDTGDPVWVSCPGGIRNVGHDSDGFAWDNERPAHPVLLQPYRLADRLVSNARWLEFIADGGYRNPLLWLSDGWSTVAREGWQAPLYWEERDGAWHQMSLAGLRPVDPAAPVCHISYYEADAFARWASRRLPSEFEWEHAATAGFDLRDLYGARWQWTQSAYLPYPGYRAPEGALGEYNGKFMVSQQVLRGASSATPAGHSRPTYRNFFYPRQRWQFTGLRLAADAA